MGGGGVPPVKNTCVGPIQSSFALCVGPTQKRWRSHSRYREVHKWSDSALSVSTCQIRKGRFSGPLCEFFLFKNYEQVIMSSLRSFLSFTNLWFFYLSFSNNKKYLFIFSKLLLTFYLTLLLDLNMGEKYEYINYE